MSSDNLILPSSPSFSAQRHTACDVEEFMKVDDEAFAQQLTLIDHGMLRNIKPAELLKRVFGEKQHLARDTPNVTAMIDHISRMSQIATTLVVKAKKLPDRVQVLKKFINIAKVTCPCAPQAGIGMIQDY